MGKYEFELVCEKCGRVCVLITDIRCRKCGEKLEYVPVGEIWRGADGFNYYKMVFNKEVKQ